MRRLGLCAAAVVLAALPARAQVPGDPKLSAALQRSGFAFTPEVKAAFLAARKAAALRELAAAGKSLPPDFLAWIDSDPVVATTIYGVENPRAYGMPDKVDGKPVETGDSPVQRLVFLRSLEIDIGAEDVRKRNPQLALALTHCYAGNVDRKSLECARLGVSLRPRPQLKLVIPPSGLVPVDTRAKDRPLDREDHIINFLEDHPVPVEQPKGGGAPDAAASAKTRPLFASELMTDPGLQEEFSAYMKARGFDIPAKRAAQSKSAYEMFLKAYLEKGRIPKAPDAPPTPAEKMAYLLRNDKWRFPAGVKRTWPRFDLNAPWPLLEYLVASDMPLRDREYVWTRFRDTGSVRKMGWHLGAKLGLNTPIVRARKLQPFEFAYGTYPMDVKDNGACREMARIGLGANYGLSIPAAHAFQPNHFCLVVVAGSPKKGFALQAEQSVHPPTWITRGGVRIENEWARLIYPLNYGFLPLLDVQTAMVLLRNLPEGTPPASRRSLLLSAFQLNPYHPATVEAVFQQCDDAADAAVFWKNLQEKLAAVDRPGCPKSGTYTGFTVKAMFDRELRNRPVPADPARLEIVRAALADRSDDLWLKYALAGSTLPALQDALLANLRASVSGNRDLQAAELLAGRIATAGAAMKDDAQRKVWTGRLREVLAGKETFVSGSGKGQREQIDPAVLAVQALAGTAPDARAAFERDLRASVSGSRSPSRTAVLAGRLATIGKGLKNGKEKQAWANVLHAIVLGNETYVTADEPTKPKLDPVVVEIYALGGDLGPARERFAADWKAAVEGQRTSDTARALDLRLEALVKAEPDPAKTKAWAELLLPLVKESGYFNEESPDGKGSRRQADPCAVRISRILGIPFP